MREDCCLLVEETERREGYGASNRVVFQQQVGDLDRALRRFHDIRPDFCLESRPFVDQDPRRPAFAWDVELGQQIPPEFDAVVHGMLPTATLSSGSFSLKPASGIFNRSAADFIPGSRQKSSWRERPPLV